MSNSSTLKDSRLYWSSFSPFVRKVIVAAQELGPDVADKIECISAGEYALTGKGAIPIATKIEIDDYNPSGRIPTLILSNGKSIFGSQAIVQYLDFVAGGAKLFNEGEARFDDLVLESLADGIMESALLLRYETTLRPEALRWNQYQTGLLSKITRTLASITPSSTQKPHFDLPDPSASQLGAGAIALASALWYLSLRFSALVDWKKDPELKEWAEKVFERESWKRADAMKPRDA
ncbi:hypothetical protein T439DRAFT_347590 [Meredithblackwellia eburnea MCA 4105]